MDAEQIFAAPEMMELKLRQVAFADMLILNKVDPVTPEEIERIKAWLDDRFHRYRLVEASGSNVPHAPRFDVLQGVDDGQQSGVRGVTALSGERTMNSDSKEEQIPGDEGGAAQRPMSRRDALMTAGLAGVAAVSATATALAQTSDTSQPTARAAEKAPATLQAKNPYGGKSAHQTPRDISVTVSRHSIATANRVCDCCEQRQVVNRLAV